MPMATKTPPANPLAVKVGERIRALRLARGMKQETLALEVGYSSRGTIAQFENGLALPSIEKALDIARVLRVHPGALFDDTSEVPHAAPTVLSMLADMANEEFHATFVQKLQFLVDLMKLLQTNAN